MMRSTPNKVVLEHDDWQKQARKENLDRFPCRSFFQANPSLELLQSLLQLQPKLILQLIRFRYPVDLNELLKDLSPECLLYQDDLGRTPLHWALLHHNWHDALQLLRANPVGCRISDADGLTPLHVLFMESTTATVDSGVLAMEMIECVDRVTSKLVCLALLYRHSEQMVNKLLDKMDATARNCVVVESTHENLLLVAITTGYKDLKAFLSPESAHHRDVSGNTILDWLYWVHLRDCHAPINGNVARRRYIPKELINAEIEPRRLLARLEDLFGDCLLSQVCRIPCPPELLKIVLTHTSRIYQKESSCHPLHGAAQIGSREVRFPMGRAGKLSYYYEPSPVTMVLAYFPMAVCERDEKGQLPLHAAIENGVDERPLLQVFPDSIECRDTVTNLFPFQQAAVGVDAQTDVIYRLLRCRPSLI